MRVKSNFRFFNMKYIDEFRNTAAARGIKRRIAAIAGKLPATHGDVRIMEVCGTHTMAIARYGINSILPSNVEVVSGPGCPVCVTDPGYIDTAVELAERGCIVATFGDMINVPGSSSTLADCRSRGHSIEVCYSPENAVSIAESNPGREVVFLAIGFETTIPPVTSIVRIAEKKGLSNISLLTAFKTIPPGLGALLRDPELRIDAFLCPAHVSAVIGTAPYEPFARDYSKPCVIAGFEPLDILFGIEGILQQVKNRAARVENQYSRVVKPEGNRTARKLMNTYLEPSRAHWRGLGPIPESGLRLRNAYSSFDAESRHALDIKPGEIKSECLCGDVIKGKIKPPQCPMFAVACKPEHPLGPCMVSQEGSCAAAYKYRQES